jgi:hypothetical protein
MKTPPQVIIFRLVTVTVTAAILAAIGFGVAGWGPLGGLDARAGQADQLLRAWYAHGWLG